MGFRPTFLDPRNVSIDLSSSGVASPIIDTGNVSALSASLVDAALSGAVVEMKWSIDRSNWNSFDPVQSITGTETSFYQVDVRSVPYVAFDVTSTGSGTVNILPYATTWEEVRAQGPFEVQQVSGDEWNVNLTGVDNSAVKADGGVPVENFKSVWPPLELCRDNYPDSTGILCVNKFGANLSVGTTEEDIWAVGGQYPFMRIASTLRVAAGGNAADTAAGTGARAITIQGLDVTGAVIEETVATAGGSASAATATAYLRVFRAYVSDAGTYYTGEAGGGAGANVGNVFIEDTVGTTNRAIILSSQGQTEMAIYTIPAGYTGYMTRFAAQVSGNQDAVVKLYQRSDYDPFVAPNMNAKRLVSRITEFSGFAERNYTVYPKFTEKTDIWAASFAGAGTTEVSAEFDLFLIPD